MNNENMTLESLLADLGIHSGQVTEVELFNPEGLGGLPRPDRDVGH